MTTLRSIVYTVYEQIFPNSSDETPIHFDIFLEAAKCHYAYKVWELNRAELNSTGENNIPSNLLSQGELNVINGEADISELNALTTLPNISWLQSVGGFECGDCEYVIMDLNKWKLLCKDPSRKFGDKAVIPLSNKILFPEGTFDSDKKVPIVYANTGGGIDDDTQINEAIGMMVRKELLKEFGVRFPEDKSNNSNSNT